jgi:hypothetical protein
MILTIKYSFKEDASWLDISSQGLHGKIQTGVTQMYWQWQGQGRTSTIEYGPENVDSPFVINMTQNGLPILQQDDAGCFEFLSWFIDKNLLNKSLNVTTTYISKSLYNNSEKTRGLSNGSESTQEAGKELNHAYCQFEYAGKFHTYDINTGQLTLTD